MMKALMKWLADGDYLNGMSGDGSVDICAEIQMYVEEMKYTELTKKVNWLDMGEGLIRDVIDENVIKAMFEWQDY